MHQDIWTEQVARRYDESTAALFSPEVLGPTVDLLARLAGTGRALEFAIGTGRVAIPLFERGIQVAGIELSAPMAAELHRKVGDAIPVALGDMATTTAPGRFTLVYLVFNTITNLLSQEEQVACFRNAARHLEPGGYFAVEVFIPELRRLPPGQTACPFEVSETTLGFDAYDLVNQRLVSHHYRQESDGSISTFQSPHRYAWPAELDLMATIAGLELHQRVADWQGHPFTDESTSHVSVWRLPG